MHSSQVHFKSDSTYYSVHENSNEASQKRKHSSQDSLRLDEIHNKIILHWEGKRLMEKIQVQEYMKQISKMKFKTYRDQYFAEKIQLSLSKICQLLSKFEINLSQSSRSKLLPDPTENCFLSQDLIKVQNEIVSYDPKQVLIESENIDNEQSFPLDMLTKDNFLISNNEHMADVAEVDKNSLQAYIIEETVNSQDLFCSQSNASAQDYYLQSSKTSEATRFSAQSTNFGENIPRKRKRLMDVSENVATEEFTFPPSCENHVQSNGIYGVKKQFSSQKPEVPALTKVEIPEQSVKCNSLVIKDGSSDIIEATGEISTQGILKCDTVVDETSVRSSEEDIENISEILNNSIAKEAFLTDQRVGIAKKDLTFIGLEVKNSKDVVELGNTFNEAYNKRINKICRYSTDDESKTSVDWNQVQKDLERGTKVAKRINDSLKGLFEKLSVTEQGNRINRNHYKYKYNFDKFSLEDRNKFVVDEFIGINKATLEETSVIFKEKLKKPKNVPTTTAKKKVFDYENCDWHAMFENSEGAENKNQSTDAL